MLLLMAVLRQLLQGLLALGMMKILQFGQLLLVVNSLYNKPPCLFLDLDQFADVLLLKAGPGIVQAAQRPLQLGSARPIARRLAEALQDHFQSRPGPLQRLCTPHGLGAELELVPVHPDHGVLLGTRLQDIHPVASGLVREEGTVVDGEGRAVGAWRLLQSQGTSGLVQVFQEGPTSAKSSLALRVQMALFHDQSTLCCNEPCHGRLLGAVETIAVLRSTEEPPEHGLRK
mmetsp:Transcript_81325/g.252403  ORF Transcript_81325/g.252403 Transcript_81325/m.252403 type:complete len:230 (+) Transcript_81325:287-976(+)